MTVPRFIDAGTVRDWTVARVAQAEVPPVDLDGAVRGEPAS